MSYLTVSKCYLHLDLKRPVWVACNQLFLYCTWVFDIYISKLAALYVFFSLLFIQLIVSSLSHKLLFSFLFLFRDCLNDAALLIIAAEHCLRSSGYLDILYKIYCIKSVTIVHDLSIIAIITCLKRMCELKGSGVKMGRASGINSEHPLTVLKWLAGDRRRQVPWGDH